MIDERSFAGSLIYPLVQRALNSPDRTAVIFIEEDGRSCKMSAGSFHQEAGVFAAGLQENGVGPGDLVVFVMQHSLTLLTGFWGAMYAGAVPSIFPYLTEKLDPEIYVQRVRTLVAHSGVAAVITSGPMLAQLNALFEGLACKVIDAEKLISSKIFHRLAENEFNLDQVAFLQHSSGTTGLQKGVALTHAAVKNQIRAYARAIEVRTETDIVVSWLPLYHDMGLIAGFVMPLYLGLPLVLMSPFQWVRDPGKLFHLVDEYSCTLCWLPNFAYNHMARSVRLRGIEGIDLSSLRMAVNCSEPVRLDSHRLFLERFARFGLRSESLATCYAMAENTFAVTQSKPGEDVYVDWVNLQSLQSLRIALPGDPGVESVVPVVSCGKAIDDVSIAIVSEESEILPDRTVGEVMLKSNSMLREYYRRPDLTREAIRDGWFLTGDMGYMANDQLFITGRKKDLIIVAGKNIYPQDLEAIANQVDGIHPGRSIAFGVENKRMGTDDVVMVCELKDVISGTPAAYRIEEELRRQIVKQTEIALADLRLVSHKWLIKTSSGKIDRISNKQKYLTEFG